MQKSHIASFLLTFLFGPLGLFYSSVGSALFFIILAIFAVPLTAGYAAIPFWIVSILWGFVCVSSYNSKVTQHEAKTVKMAQQVIQGEVESPVKNQSDQSWFWILLTMTLLIIGYNIITNN